MVPWRLRALSAPSLRRSRNSYLDSATPNGLIDAGSDRKEGFLDFKLRHVKVTAKKIPEPLTILGTATALGIGTVFKRKYSKQLKKTKSKAA